MWIQSATLALLMTSFVAINANDHDERKKMMMSKDTPCPECPPCNLNCPTVQIPRCPDCNCYNKPYSKPTKPTYILPPTDTANDGPVKSLVVIGSGISAMKFIENVQKCFLTLQDPYNQKNIQYEITAVSNAENDGRIEWGGQLNGRENYVHVQVPIEPFDTAINVSCGADVQGNPMCYVPTRTEETLWIDAFDDSDLEESFILNSTKFSNLKTEMTDLVHTEIIGTVISVQYDAQGLMTGVLTDRGDVVQGDAYVFAIPYNFVQRINGWNFPLAPHWSHCVWELECKGTPANITQFNQTFDQNWAVVKNQALDVPVEYRISYALNTTSVVISDCSKYGNFSDLYEFKTLDQVQDEFNTIPGLAECKANYETATYWDQSIVTLGTNTFEEDSWQFYNRLEHNVQKLPWQPNVLFTSADTTSTTAAPYTPGATAAILNGHGTSFMVAGLLRKPTLPMVLIDWKMGLFDTDPKFEVEVGQGIVINWSPWEMSPRGPLTHAVMQYENEFAWDHCNTNLGRLLYDNDFSKYVPGDYNLPQSGSYVLVFWEPGTYYLGCSHFIRDDGHSVHCRELGMKTKIVVTENGDGAGTY